MNIVDVLKDQLKGDAGKTFASIIGARGKDMEKILGAGLPCVLSGLASIASSKNGADKLATSIDSLGTANLSDVGSMLDTESMDTGSKILGGLIGSDMVDSIADLLAKFTGIQPRIIKKAIGFLTPLVLATVASIIKGTKPDGTAIAKLFEDQKSNIADSIPADLSLNEVPGFKELSKVAEGNDEKVASKVGKGLGQLLVPISVIAALIAAIFFLINNAEQASAGKNKAESALKQSTKEQTVGQTGDEKSNVGNVKGPQ